MTAPPARGRRKRRAVRDEPAPDQLTLLLRAATDDAGGTITDIVDDAARSAAVYAIEVDGGGREVLFGVSTFALRNDDAVAITLARFPDAPRYLAVTVGQVRSSGFAIYATGANPDHYDIQLVPGVADGPDVRSDDIDLRPPATRLVELAGPLRPNPSYAGQKPVEDREEET